MVEYNTSCGLPEFPWNISVHSKDEGLSNVAYQNISDSSYVTRDGLSKVILSNLEEIQSIRKFVPKLS